jgi:superfamily II DNA or RNA helicase
MEDKLDEVVYFGDKEIRWYQHAARNESIQAIYDGHKRICIVMPTGAGKTITMACLLSDSKLKEYLNIKDRNIRVLFVAHNHRLLTQAERTFVNESQIDIITQSMQSNIPDDLQYDIVVLDECHHEACITFQYRLEQTNPDSILIGTTATPNRNDGSLIKFQYFVEPISREDAVHQGYLAETNLHSFVDGSERSKAEITIDILDSYIDQMEGTLIFVRTKAEARLIDSYLDNLGYKSVAILDQKKEETNILLDSFSNKEIQFIVSCNRLGEGIDISGVNTIIISRTIGSFPLLNQYIGRAARPDCDCNIYEIINPLAADNIDTTVVVGTPKTHKLIYKQKGQWTEELIIY